MRDAIVWSVTSAVLLAWNASCPAKAAGNNRSRPTARVGEEGLPRQLEWAPRLKGGILTGPCRLLLRTDKETLAVPSLRKVSGSQFEVEWQEQRLRIGVAYGRSTEADLLFAIENLAAESRTLELQLIVPVRPQADQAFFPAGASPHVTLRAGEPEVAYGYGAAGIGMALPLGSVYCVKADWGLALFGDHRAPIPAFGLTVARSQQASIVKVILPGLNCKPGEKVTRKLYLAGTEGDWRPALASALAQFPEVFEPQNPEVAKLHGPFVCSGGTPPDRDIEKWYAQGTRVVEIHCTAPFYGMYVPDREPFVAFCDDAYHFLKKRLKKEELPLETASWRELRDFVEKHQKPTMTRDAVRDYIERLHKHGIKGLIYFNPTEAWAPFAAAEFPGDRVMTANGTPAPTWYESVCVIPDKNRPWGKYILDQLRGELEQYPKVDGVFFDQSAGGGHDLTDLCAEGCRMVRARGRICWWNGPYNAELAALADGMMSEGGGTGTYRTCTEIIQYYGIAGKPIVSLGPATPEAYSELLTHGLIPQPVGPEAKEMAERWFPLFQWFRNRRWVLKANALETDDDVIANLYRTPDGNYIVPMAVSSDETPQAGRDARRHLRFGIGVKVRVEDGNEVKGVYLLTPEALGYHKLPLQRTKGTIVITVPRLSVAGLLVLAKSGVFASFDGELSVVRGSSARLRLTVDNWTARAVSAQMAIQDQKASSQLAAWKSAQVEATVSVPTEPTVKRLTVQTLAKVGNSDLGGKAELWVDDPILLQVATPSSVRDDETAEVKVTVLSHAPQEAKVRIVPSTSALAFEPESRTLVAGAGQAVVVSFTATPRAAGRSTVKVTAVGGELTASDTAPMEVLATALGPGGLQAVRSAELALDVFGSDAGPYANKPIKLNGVVIGTVPQGTGDNWSCDHRVPLPHDALGALKETNELVIENAVGDAFKVRNVHLLLRMRGGITAVSSVDKRVYTGCAGWLYGEGKEFPSGQPLTGMMVTIPIDPSRKERYEESLGQPKIGKFILEINGSDGGPYENKPVSINNCVIGRLPAAGDWTEKALDLTADALASLSDENEVVIENSDPPDAFKVRRARIEVVNTKGQRIITATEEGAYTSVGWEFAEGKVGSPIRFVLRFKVEG